MKCGILLSLNCTTVWKKHIPKKSSNNKFMNPPLWMDGKTKVAILKKLRA
jgi:hypothetical protein